MGQPVVKWQMLSKNPEKLSEFYEQLFDWKSNTDNELGYRQLDTSSTDGIHGGIWQAPPEATSAVSLYVEVPDVEEYLNKAVSLGAKVIIPPQKLPDGDEMAVVLDIEGVPVGLVKSKM